MHPLNPPLSARARKRIRKACAMLGWELQGHLSPQLGRSVVVLNPTGGRMARWAAVATGLTCPVPWQFWMSPVALPGWERWLLRRCGIQLSPPALWEDQVRRFSDGPAACLLLAPGMSPEAADWVAWTEPFRGHHGWVVPVGVDRRRTKIHIHHGFHWGPYDDRNVHYVQRYFRYFEHPRNPER